MIARIRVLLAGMGCIALGACAVQYVARAPRGAPAPPPAGPQTLAAATATSPASRGRGGRGRAVAAPSIPQHPATSPGTRPAPAPATMTADGYRLVWHDEFDKDGPLNPADWGYENGFVRNQEAQFYQPDNALCKDGFLLITARKESKPNPRYNAGGARGRGAAATAAAGPTTRSTAPATSTARGRAGGAGSNAWPNLPTIEITAASINTRGKHEFTYGRFEVRARIDVRPGSWPAFWSLGTQGGWPGNGEVDIMEYYRNMVLANIAWQGANGAVWNSVRLNTATLPADFSEKFHTWRMDWDETTIKLFLDDVKVNEQDLAKTINTGGRGTGVNPFLNRPVYLLLNQAIGGQNGGDYSQTEFPINFYVDYVRVWQKSPATQPK